MKRPHPRLLLKRLRQARLVDLEVQGVDIARDIDRLTDVRPKVVFDVGGHTGQTVRQFKRWWPGAEIHCFEPNPTVDPVKDSGARMHRVALGAAEGEATLYVRSDTSNSSLVADVQDRSGERVLDEVKVPVTTIDKVCADNGIARVDFLKIDTEGFELEVLRGAAGMLERGAVEFVQTEVGMNPANTKHVPFDDVRGFLEPFGFSVFGVYSQWRERPIVAPRLRRADVVFIRG